MTMRAWPTGEHEKIRARIARHQELDEIVQGIGYELYARGASAGCAIGCSLDSYDHSEYARVILGDNEAHEGIALAKLIDRIHEGLLFENCVFWPGRVANALTPGADTGHVLSRWFVWLLSVEIETYDVTRMGATVAGLYERRIAGDEPSRNEWLRAAGVNITDAEAIAEATDTHATCGLAVVDCVYYAELMEAARLDPSASTEYAQSAANTVAESAALIGAHMTTAYVRRAAVTTPSGRHVFRANEPGSDAQGDLYTRMADALIEIMASSDGAPA